MKERMNFFVKIAGVCLAIVISGCSLSNNHHEKPLNKTENYYQYIQPSFTEYLRITKQWLVKNRRYISDDHHQELSMNMPFELGNKKQSEKAILLVHGLGDSPFSFSDIAHTLQKQGFYVQALLLPGHGSNPDDLKLPNYQDWQTIVDHYANLLKQDFSQVWLGGFSTGGNLVTIHALEQGNIAGLMLFSPGFQSRMPKLERLAPLVSVFYDGYKAQEKNLARYTSAPLNGAIAYTESAVKVRDHLANNKVTIPTLIAISEADSVVDPNAIKTFFINRFSNKKSRLIWYGEKHFQNPKIHAYTMKLEKLKVSTGSHMSPLFAPSNWYYGMNGKHKMCMNSFNKDAIKRCENGETVWYSAWGYEEKQKIHARLTWNPYYFELATQLKHLVQP